MYEAILEVFPVKIGQNSRHIKGTKMNTPQLLRDYLTNIFKKYPVSNQREDIMPVLFTFVVDCLKSEVAELVRNTKIEWY